MGFSTLHYTMQKIIPILDSSSFAQSLHYILPVHMQECICLCFFHDRTKHLHWFSRICNIGMQICVRSSFILPSLYQSKDHVCQCWRHVSNLDHCTDRWNTPILFVNWHTWNVKYHRQLHWLTLKGQSKKWIWKCRLLKSSAANNYLALLTN